MSESSERTVKQRLFDAGFDRVGIASAEPLVEDRRRLDRWLAEGRCGEMAYLARNRELREAPGRFLPGARSVIVAAAAYPLKVPPRGPLAAYACCPDYHDVLREALTRGTEAVTRLDPDADCRVAVDSAPVFERALAVRAGLGRIGYSTNLVIPGLGSAVVLGVIVTTAMLAPDAPLDPGGCESCGACLSACPTGALSAPYAVDARKCISYLTIEKKGDFVEGEARSLKGWAFGCDHCTAACGEAEGGGRSRREADEAGSRAGRAGS